MKYGLIAERVGHSFSAEIHKKLLGYEYELKAIGQTEFDSFMIARNFNAINVTIPYKEKVIPYLDFIDDTAKAVGAVNTVVNHDGKLYGYNTDVNGFIALIHKSEMVFEGKKVLVLGSGGTSKTAAYVSKMLGCASVFRVSRNRREDCISYEDATRYHNDSEVIINTTPCGMFPDIGRSAIDIGSFSQLECVIDVVYNPIRTKLVTDARKRGINATGGLYMLVAQAAYAAEKFIGKKADTKKIYDIYNSLLLSKQNVVLTGMPGCGKSAAGRCLSEKTGRRLIDTDELIIEKTGQKPRQSGRYRNSQARHRKSRQFVSILTNAGFCARLRNC